MASPIKLLKTLENKVPSEATNGNNFYESRAGEGDDLDDGDDGDLGEMSRAMTKLSILVDTEIDNTSVPNFQKDGDEDSKDIELSASHLSQRLKFLLDSSTIQFCDAIVREGYQVMQVAMNLSHVDVLRLACVFGLSLLTLDRGYLSVAHNTNMYGVLILPEIFVSVDQTQEQKTTWLCELLRCHDEVNKIRLFPIKACMAKNEKEKWIVEEAAGQELVAPPNTDGPNT